MNCWQDLPNELQLRDVDLMSLSMAEVGELFNKAEKYDVLDLFTKLFWESMERVRTWPDSCTMQKCVDFLEERKRSIGRHYNMCKKKHGHGWLTRFQAIRYNEVESHIAWLVDQYACVRRSKPYRLEV